MYVYYTINYIQTYTLYNFYTLRKFHKMATINERIIEAATQLQASGKKPTMEAIREVMGGGSFATISPVLRNWRESQDQQQVVTVEMPNDIKAIFDKSALELWKGLASLTAERITKVEAESAKQINSAQTERDEALTEIERLECLLNTSFAQNKTLTDEHRELTQQIHKQQITLEFVEANQIELKNELQQLRNTLRLRDGELGELRGEIKVIRELTDRA